MRRLDNWLESYLLYAENTEPPLNYHIWTGLSVVSSVLQRRCYLISGHDTIYPNTYVVLIGAAGRTRKGTAARLGKRFLTQLKNVNCVSESITREGLINFMKRKPLTHVDKTNGIFTMHSSVTCISEELQVFLGIRNTRFLADLTDWYDSHDVWTYETIGRGSDQITGVCFTLLGCSAPDWIPSMFPLEAVGGGFSSRVIFVYEEKKRKCVRSSELSAAEIKLKEDLLHDLQIMLSLSGKFTMTNEALEFYNEWYEGHDAALDEGNYPVKDPRFNSYCERKATHMRKIGMLLSACRGNDMTVRVPDLRKSLELLSRVEVNMPYVFAGIGQARDSGIQAQVLNFIREQKRVSRSTLMRKFIGDLDTEALRRIEDFFRNSKLVKIVLEPIKNEQFYEYSE